MRKFWNWNADSSSRGDATRDVSEPVLYASSSNEEGGRADGGEAEWCGCEGGGGENFKNAR